MVQVKRADDVDGPFNVSMTETVLVMPPPVIVRMALFVPKAAVPVSTLTVILPLLDAEFGLTVNHPAFLLTLHDVLDATDID